MGGVDQTGEGPLAAARIASSVPGRLRLRLADGADRLDRIAAAAEMVGARADVIAVEPRWRTGSLVVQYDPAGGEALCASLRELRLGPTASPAVRAEAGADQAPARVMEALTRANDVVSRRTQGKDLRTLVPLGLGMLALRQLVRGRERLVDAPWYLLAWYAAETFQKFHRPATRGE